MWCCFFYYLPLDECALHTNFERAPEMNKCIWWNVYRYTREDPRSEGRSFLRFCVLIIFSTCWMMILFGIVCRIQYIEQPFKAELTSSSSRFYWKFNLKFRVINHSSPWTCLTYNKHLNLFVRNFPKVCKHNKIAWKKTSSIWHVQL